MSSGASTPFSWDFPEILTPQGLQPQSPSTLRSQVIANATANSPGITTNLPGSLISDMTGTVLGALTVIDQAKVETLNNMTPYAANVFVLGQLGQIYLGQSQPGIATNTSVNVVFTAASNVGWVIPNGFIITDGTNNYQIQVGGVIGSGGTSGSITAIAVQPGSWSIPANTTFTAVTQPPSTVSITSITNPLAGTPAGANETWAAFRSRVLMAGIAACVSGPRLIKTLIAALGVPLNLISVQQVTTGTGMLRVCVGGGIDNYEIANAIFMGVSNPASLAGSAVSSGRNVTVSLTDYPDTYSVERVQAPVQTVLLAITWNTTLANFTGGAAFPGLVQQPIADYINNLAIGQPINLLLINELFQQAVQNVLDASLIDVLDYTVTINGVVTAPTAGTWIVPGDAESSWSITTSAISVTQA